MSYGTTPGDEQPDPAEQQPGAFQPTPEPAPMYPEGEYTGPPGQQAPPSYPQPGYGQPGYGQPGSDQGGYFPPGYAAGPTGQPPATHLAWAWIAAVGGVLFSLILGLPTAIIALNHARKVRPNWQAGNVQAAITASRKARTWAIVSTILDILGIGVLVIVIGAAHTTSSNSNSNFSNPAVVAASIKTQLQKRISDPQSQYYIAGVSVTSVVCTPAGGSTDHCVDYLSNGQTATETAVISSNGNGYVTR
jgi:Interferon-induced transmembrane protein